MVVLEFMIGDIASIASMFAVLAYKRYRQAGRLVVVASGYK
ncbi:hypothetical protein HRbin05_00585 [archaeon HR05]|nr:hypothetical protein HRbin05_00585 [archaeon HR05]